MIRWLLLGSLVNQMDGVCMKREKVIGLMNTNTHTHTQHIPLVEIDIGLLAHQIGISTAHAFDLGQGVHDFLLAVDVGVE